MNKIVASLSLTAAAILNLVSVPVLASPVTLGFEGRVADDGQVLDITPYTENGFTLTNLRPKVYSDGIFGKNAANTRGSAAFVFCAYDSSCNSGSAIKLSGTGPFTLLGLDVGDWEKGNATGRLELIGTLLGGGSVTASLSAGALWSSYTLSGFEQLSSVEFRGYGIYALGIDNLNLDTGSDNRVPEPGSLVLASLALAALGFSARRRS